MKGQDIVILLRLASLFDLQREEGLMGVLRSLLPPQHQKKVECEQMRAKLVAALSGSAGQQYTGSLAELFDYRAWEPIKRALKGTNVRIIDPFSVRGLEEVLHISKSEINASLKRCIDCGLATIDRRTNLPRPIWRNLEEFIIHGLKYVFPAKPGTIGRGTPTSFFAPPLKNEVISAGAYDYVWPSPEGKHVGLTIEPLFKTVPKAVEWDRRLYEYLALVDAIRLGNPREAGRAKELLSKRLNRHDQPAAGRNVEDSRLGSR